MELASMCIFKTMKDLENSLNLIEVDETFVRYVLENARPTLRLLRNQYPDDKIPSGYSKFGGEPDLHERMEWPTRPPFPDASERSRVLLQLAEEYEERGKPYLDLATKYRALAPLLGEPFPLTFICQVDLAGLNQHGDAFHPLLPNEGRLLVFVDEVGWNGGARASDRVAMRLVWDQSPQAQLRRRSTPAPIVRWYEEFAASSEAPRWSDLTFADRFTAHPVYTIPHPWSVRFPEDHPLYETYRDFYDELSAVAPDEHSDEVTAGDDFGDQLGGWPEPLQRYLQEDTQLHFHGFDRHIGSQDEKKLLEASSEWQLVLSLGGEYWGGTRTLFGAGPDGQFYVMMREEDLKARRFENAWMIVQST
jgi:uncharacterized protein YwqG